jgi:hypothetical protein
MTGLIDYILGLVVRKDRPPVAAAATADNIVAASATTGKIPLVVQQYTGAAANAIDVYANGSNRFSVDSNGSNLLMGAVALRYNAITPTTTPGTAIAIPRVILPVADATTTNRHVQLPAANSVSAGQILIVMDLAATAATGNITVNRAGSDTIVTTSTAQTSVTITANGSAILFISDGTSVWKCLRMTG